MPKNSQNAGNGWHSFKVPNQVIHLLIITDTKGLGHFFQRSVNFAFVPLFSVLCVNMSPDEHSSFVQSKVLWRFLAKFGKFRINEV